MIAIALAIALFVVQVPLAGCSREIEEITLPNVRVPNVTLPNVNLSNLDFSSVVLPEIQLPDMAFPNVDWPSVTFPDVAFPQVDFSGVTLPTVNLAAVGSSSVAVVDTLRSNLAAALLSAGNATQSAYQQATEVFDRVDLLSLAIGGSVAYETVATSLQGVPQDFAELLREMPKVAKRTKRAGVRVGEQLRSNAEAFKLFQKTPGATLMDATEQKVRTWLGNKHGSHIQSHAHGGGNNSSNIFWELGKVNLARGKFDTSRFELVCSRLYNAAEGVVQNSSTIAKLGLQSSAVAVLIDSLVEAELHAMDLAAGEISIEEFLSYIQESATRTAISAAAFYTLTVIAISVFPELVPILSTPALVTASQVVLGTRLALPLLRLIPAL